MAHSYIPKTLREKVAATAGHRCGYCLTPQAYTAMPMHVEHIIPQAKERKRTAPTLRAVSGCPFSTHAIRTGTSTFVGAKLVLSVTEVMAS